MRVQQPPEQCRRARVLGGVVAERHVRARQRLRGFPQRAQQHDEGEVQVPEALGVLAVHALEAFWVRAPHLAPGRVPPRGLRLERDVHVDARVHTRQKPVQHPLLVAHVVRVGDPAEAVLVVDGLPDMAPVVPRPALGVELQVDVLRGGARARAVAAALAHVQPELGPILRARRGVIFGRAALQRLVLARRDGGVHRRGGVLGPLRGGRGRAGAQVQAAHRRRLRRALSEGRRRSGVGESAGVGAHVRGRRAACLRLLRVRLGVGLVPELARSVQVHLEQAEVRGVRQLREDLVQLMLVRRLHILDVARRVADLASHELGLGGVDRDRLRRRHRARNRREHQQGRKRRRTDAPDAPRPHRRRAFETVRSIYSDGADVLRGLVA